jgi:hypothetical protein
VRYIKASYIGIAGLLSVVLLLSLAPALGWKTHAASSLRTGVNMPCIVRLFLGRINIVK